MNIKSALKSYLSSLENVTTKTNYEIALKEFSKRVTVVTDINQSTVLKYKRSLSDKSSQTIAARLSAVRSFCDYCWTKGWIDRDPSLPVKNKPQKKYTQAKNITLTEFKKIMSSMDTTSLIGVRNYLLVRLLFLLGDVEKVRLITWEHTLPPVLQSGKDSYETMLRISLVRDPAVFTAFDGFLFFSLETNDSSKALSISRIRKILQLAALNAGFSEKFLDFQALKRLRASQIYKKTNSLEAVRKFCGHKTLKSTKAFIKTLL